jgi:hypothetical protein
MLVDLRAKGITGKEAEAVLGDAHMTINKNAIPNDPEKPMVTSGRADRHPCPDHPRLQGRGSTDDGQPAGRRAGQPARPGEYCGGAREGERPDPPLPVYG